MHISPQALRRLASDVDDMHHDASLEILALDAATDEAAIGTLAFDLESAAAQTYVFAAGELSTPDLRSTIMTIGGIEARHAAILKMVALGGAPAEVFPDDRAFWPAENPLADRDGAILE